MAQNLLPSIDCTSVALAFGGGGGGEEGQGGVQGHLQLGHLLLAGPAPDAHCSRYVAMWLLLLLIGNPVSPT